MAILFTADTHFGHENIISYCGRPFNSIAEHDDALVANWNSAVNKGDTVYHLGDFAFMKRDEVRSLRGRLNGTVHLVLGNHDRETVVGGGLFASIVRYTEIKLGSTKVVLFHFPIERWNKMHHGSWHFHGHSHGTLKRVEENRVDVGVDAWGYRPVRLEELGVKWA